MNAQILQDIMPQIFKIMMLNIMVVNIIMLIDIRHQFNNYLIINDA